MASSLVTLDAACYTVGSGNIDNALSATVRNALFAYSIVKLPKSVNELLPGLVDALMLIPIVGLVFLAAALFVLGGINLVGFVLALFLGEGGATEQLIYEIVEFIHFFLIGTVLYITAMGLFQLFISELKLPGWLTVDDIEELELNLVGVVIVIIGVNFLSVIINPGDINLLNYGAGYALPIIGLSLFIFVRSRNQAKDADSAREDADPPTVAKPDV